MPSEVLNILFIAFCLLATGAIFQMACWLMELMDRKPKEHDWTCGFCGHPKDGWRFSAAGNILCSECGLPVIEDGKPTIKVEVFDRILGIV